MIISVLHQLLTYHMYLHFNPYFAIIAFFHGPWTIQGIGPIFRHLYFFVFGKLFAICLGRPIILRRRRSLSWWIRIRQRKNSILYQTTLSQSLGEANMQFWGHDHKQCTNMYIQCVIKYEIHPTLGNMTSFSLLFFICFCGWWGW